jgi:transcription elongation factor
MLFIIILMCISLSVGLGVAAFFMMKNATPSGRYVKLIHTVAQDNSAPGNADDKNKILNLAELEVFASGGTTSLAAGKVVTGTALAASYPGANLVDGVMNNFAHTWGRDASVKDEFLVDLGSVQEIEKIKITNRVDCCKNRAIGIKAVILAEDGTTVVKETPPITKTADTYTFTFPGTDWA